MNHFFAFTNLSASDWAAWYAAIVATAALGWEFYTHFTKGPRLCATAILDMADGCPEIQVSIRNVGDVPSSIERFTFVHHKRDSEELPFVVVGAAGDVLRKLKPGEHVEGRLWPPSDDAGMIQMHPSFKSAKSGWLLIRHSASSEPTFIRVEPPKGRTSGSSQ